MTLSASVALQRLQRLYQTGYHDQMTENVLSKLISAQIANAEAELQRVETQLAHYEAQFGLTTTDFEQRWQAGQMPDTADYMEWNAFTKMRQRTLVRLAILRE